MQTPTPTTDERATILILRWIDTNESAEDIACQIITRAYDDAAHMRRSDPDWAEFYTPRLDAGDALREYFDSENPLAADRKFINVNDTIVTAGLWDSLILYALDRVDWYSIVDQLRERMAAEDAALEENRRADLARAAERAAIEDAVWPPIWRTLNFL
jgi:hypothetical protein